MGILRSNNVTCDPNEYQSRIYPVRKAHVFGCSDGQNPIRVTSFERMLWRGIGMRQICLDDASRHVTSGPGFQCLLILKGQIFRGNSIDLRDVGT
jgi:hypothetical protein